MSDARSRAAEMVVEAETIRRAPKSEQGALKILEFENLADALQNFLEYHSSYRQACFSLVSKVNALFGVVSTMRSGRGLTESLGDSAPAFKRALVDLEREIRAHDDA